MTVHKRFLKILSIALMLSLLFGCSIQKATDRPVFSNAIELRDYLSDGMDAGTLEFSFVYTVPKDLTAYQVQGITNAAYVDLRQEGNTYFIKLTEYPGDRIVDAWRSGDRTVLTNEENLALDYSLDLLESWKSLSSDPWEIEYEIFNFLARHITYTDSETNYYTAESIPRQHTAIGALLDRQANCQGYTDAFYLLGTLAGLEVGRLNVETPDGGHILNTVCLDGQWYIVDVTYADGDDGSPPSMYLFNAGMDRIREYTWPPQNERNPIAKESNEYFYFLHEDAMFSDVEEAAAYIANSWSGYSGESIQIALTNQTEDTVFSDALYDALVELDLAFSFYYWYFTDGTDLYYIVYFE